MVTTVLTCSFWGLGGCSKPLDTSRTVEPYSSFGEVVYREGCQRVDWTGQLAQKAAGQRDTVDVSGTEAHQVCVMNMPAPSPAPEKVKAIQKQRDLLIATVDLILPKDFLDNLQNFMLQLLPLHDDGTMTKSILSVADLLDTMYKDPDFTPALARLALRAGYRPTKTAAGLVHTIVEYPNIDDFLGKLLGMIAPGGTANAEWENLNTALSKELKTSQPVSNPADSERTLRLALNLIMSTNPDLGTGTARPLVSRDYRGMAVPNAVNGQLPAPFVDTDGDGLADVDSSGHFVDANLAPITVPAPFPEAGAMMDPTPRDNQGRVLQSDGKTFLYNYLDLDGTVIGGMTRETLKMMDPAKDTTLGLVYGATALLGTRSTQTKMYMDSMGGMIDSLTYNGFDTAQSALLDMLHAFIQILGDPNADQTLLATQTLLNQHESPTARLIKAMFDVNDQGKMHPEAVIPSTSILYDDLSPIIVRILRVPGLAEDLVKALENPHSKGLAPMIARLMQARNQIDFDQNSCASESTCILGLCNCAHPLNMNGADLDGIDPVDRTQPDVDYNRSLLQRIAHLIHDANNAQYCSKPGATLAVAGFTAKTYTNACDMFKVPDLALFYILNMATPALIKNTQGTSRNDTTWKVASFCENIQDSFVTGIINTLGETAALEDQTQITGFLCQPTPAALNRALFLDWDSQSDFIHNATDPVPCTDGDLFKDVHDKSIMAWETTMANNPSGFANDTFYDAIRPLVDAFASHDECVQVDPETGNCMQLQNAAKILVDLFGMLHEHWASPKSSYFGHTYQSSNRGAPRFSFPDNVVSYEPLLVQVLGTMDIVPAVIDLAPTLDSFTVDGTASGQPALPVLIGTAQYLFDPAAAPAGLAYRNGATSTVMSDGTTPVPQTTPYYLLADAFAHKRLALNSIPADQSTAWQNATSALVDQMLTMQQNTDGTYQFQNRHVHAVSSIMIDFLRARLQSHAKQGDLADWVHKTVTQDLTDTMGGPTFAALGDFVAKVEADPDSRTQLYNLLQYLMDEADNDLVFQTALTTLADQVQMFMDDPDLVPVAHIFGAAIDPAKGTVDTQLDLMKRARDLDTNKAMLTILRNLYKLDTTNEYPASNLADVLSEVNRTRPGQGGPLDGGDYKTLLGEVRDFLTDEQRGFVKFLEIVKNRGPHN
jgi:hypothetical protein